MTKNLLWFAVFQDSRFLPSDGRSTIKYKYNPTIVFKLDSTDFPNTAFSWSMSLVRTPTYRLNLELLRQTAEDDQFQTIRDSTVVLGVHHSCIACGQAKFSKVKSLGRFAPHNLSRIDQDWRVNACHWGHPVSPSVKLESAPLYNGSCSHLSTVKYEAKAAQPRL